MEHKMEAMMKTKDNHPFLTLGISTLGAGITRVMLPPMHPELEVLVIWQQPDRANPSWSDRADVRILRVEEKGLSRSRNMALQEARTRMLWVFDDDATPDVEIGLALAKKAEKAGYAAMVGRFAGPDGVPTRPVHKRKGRMGKMDAPSVCSFEMLLNVDRVRALGVEFDTDFGLGARWTMGEEMIFVLDLIKAGGQVGSDVAVLAQHPTDTTGDRFAEEPVWMASSAALRRGYGAWAWVLRPVMAWRKRKVLGWRNAWRYLWVRP